MARFGTGQGKPNLALDAFWATVIRLNCGRSPIIPLFHVAERPISRSFDRRCLMAVNAFIMVNVEPISTKVVHERLKTIMGALVFEVLGPHDFIIDLQADTPEDITGILRNKIRPIKGVTNTVTCIYW